ncbi:uncharacterized protein LOC113147355 [Cyclospora cayetanensis]|uniref:Uncharacterized protein LOC113147355 n=1 Tax=Cyclospora cayetanensis TaxID=88456 RepID=A0A6P6S197_9EIME|nr:uncharacterized protein LOC113147355 [Cyclospora cayetanensis]
MESNQTDEEADLYDLLHLTRAATDEEIAASYRRLARLFHPDKASEGPPDGPLHRGRSHGGNSESYASSGGLPMAFVRLNHAYSILRNRTLRDIYDLEGLEGVAVAERLLRDEQAKALQLAVPPSSASLHERVSAALRQQREQHSPLRLTAAAELPYTLFFFDSLYKRRAHAALKRLGISSKSSSSEKPTTSNSGDEDDYSLQQMQLQEYPSSASPGSREERSLIQLADAAQIERQRNRERERGMRVCPLCKSLRGAIRPGAKVGAADLASDASSPLPLVLGSVCKSALTSGAAHLISVASLRQP